MKSKSAARSHSKAPAKRAKRLGSLQKRRLLMEGLEDRQLLAAGVGTPPAPDPDLFLPQLPRNIGTVVAFPFTESEAGTASGGNNSINTADFVPLGTGPGQEDTIDITGSMSIDQAQQGDLSVDIDYYAFDLRAGDILDIAVQGAGANLTMFNSNGSIWFGTRVNVPATTGFAYPSGSPLMTAGNAVGAQVVPEDGRYYLAVAPTFTSANYTVGLRAYRPVLEQTPIGSQQILYLDFDGGIYPTSDFPGSGLPFGIVEIYGLQDSLAQLGFINPITPDDVNAIIDYTVDEVKAQLHTLAEDGSLGSGTNGDYASTGIPGQYGITVLNSRDHADPGDTNPLVTRVIIGSEVTTGFPPGSLFGIAQSIDVGNFRPNEKVLAGLEPHATFAATVPLSPTATLADAIAKQLAGTITHEAGHSFGIWHTDGDNFVESLMDEGSASLVNFSQGVGNDGIFGTNDDITPYFADDRFSASNLGGPGEDLFYGFERVPAALSQVLSTGTVGSTISGTVFNDLNRNGVNGAEPGVAGVTVFADVNGNGLLDPTDPSGITNAQGQYSLNVAAGPAYNIIVLPPAQFALTTSGAVTASAGTNSANFGLVQVISDITGTKWADINGNGVFDSNESGLEGVYIYLDLDGDDRPDLGEPSAITDSNGRYSINFPGPGTYTIREVIGAGFIQTFPSSGEHTVNYNGTALTDNYNFGNLPSRDYGDAPDSYLTTSAVGGPSHGISSQIRLGTEVDRETSGFPSATALGDDLNNIDDEDGVRLLSPLGPGGTATLEITTTNTTGDNAFLQGWIDFDGNGSFDANEQVIADLALGNGVSTVNVNVPSTATVGSTYARFRYSPTPGLGVGGDADAGEVEDYQFDILAQAEIANDDEFTVSRNSLSNRLDVLANDFQSSITQLTIVSTNEIGTRGQVTIVESGKAISYTPPNGFTGRDVFEYVVADQAGNQYSASVVVNVNFQSNVPIAVDDTVDIPQGSSNWPINVLDNDVPSTAGGITITSVSGGDKGGQVTLEGGGQTVRYTPTPGFTGSEQFIYSIEDANGSVSTATVTVNSQPGAMNDDRVDFTIGIFDTVNNEPVSSVQVGQDFYVRVFVEELNNAPFDDEGVASAFLDLLYTDALVATLDTIDSDSFNFDIEFGELFQQSNFQLGNAAIPGLIDEVGAVQAIGTDGSLTEHRGPTELFTLTMTAVSPGIATFAADPADTVVAETILIGEDTALSYEFQRLGSTELTIFPASDNFASAIDDAFVNGVDSFGNTIVAGSTPNTLDVLANDNFGPTGFIQEFGIVTAPTLGSAEINDNGTPLDFSDDTIDYAANVGASGFDSFKYVIVSGDGVRSIAEVTMAIGNADADDIVEISFGLVDQFGTPIASVASGQTFGVQLFVEDLRDAISGNTFVFAAYTDMLYDSGLVTPASVPAGGRFDFDVEFDNDFDASAAVGTAARSGIIDEFGAFLKQSVASDGNVAEPNLMATVFFTAGSVDQLTTTQIIGSPADASPFQDTLLQDRDLAVPVSQIRFNVMDITLTPGSSIQNTALPEDVNADGFVTPSDALTIINALARGGEGESVRSGVFTDVNGDRKTTALDALYVINHLSRQASASRSEGESIAVSSTNAATDNALTSLSPINGSSADSDDDDDLLNLLADDQSGLA